MPFTESSETQDQTIVDYTDNYVHTNNYTKTEITILTLTNKQCQITFDLKMTIEDLKNQIYNKLNYQQNQQRIIYAGRQLEDDRTLEEYKITQNCKIFVVLKLRGGMMHPSSGKKDHEFI